MNPRINALRERINIRLYDSRARVLRYMGRANIVVALLTLLSLVYYHGFPINDVQSMWVGYIVRGSIAFYLFKFFTELLYNFRPLQFLKDRRWEAALMVFLIADILTINLLKFELLNKLGHLFSVPGLQDSFILFLQVYFLVIVGLEFGKVGDFLPKTKLSPPTLLLFSFILLILMGTGLLMLPEMCPSGQASLDFLTALFTSISASCVTGLSLIDISTALSTKGQIVVLLLMQLGGLNIISFAALFAILRGGFSIRQQSMVQENMGDSLANSARLVTGIFRITLLIEGIGMLLLALAWHDRFNDLGDTLFYSLFHSVSAFNNAGFSLFSNSLATEGLHNSYAVHWILASLIMLGAIGFGVLQDVSSKNWLKEGISRSWRDMRVSSKLGITVSFVLLLVGGTVLYLASPIGEDGKAQVSNAFFQSVSARTAGFNTINFGLLSTPALLFMIFLMFVGGGSGSTAGGIKTSTFSLVFISAWATIQGKKNINLYHHQIPWELLNRASAIFLFSAGFIFLGIFILTIFDPSIALLDLAFEQVSAFCTVGLSTGITTDLSLGSKIVIMVSMLIGRVGTLTLAFALSAKRPESNTFKYPKANFTVG